MLMICLTSANIISKESESDLLDKYLFRISEHDSEALSELYNHTSASIYGFALSILKNTHDAEDVLHDCFINIWKAADSYVSKGKPMAWILTVTRNLCLRKLNERQKASDIPQEDWEKYLTSCKDLDADSRLILYECMQTISDQEREIVILHAVAGFKHRETAELLSLPLPTVLSKYNRALKKLKQSLRKEDGNHD